MRLAGVVAAMLVVAGAAPGVARAWTLDYQAPAGCADAAAFRALAEGQRARHEPVPTLDVRVRVSGEGARWRVRLEVEAGVAAPGVRELGGASCREVVDAAALVVAFTVDGALADAAPPPAPPGPSPGAASDPDPGVVRAREPSAPVALAVAGFAGADTGTLPAAALGARAELTLGWRRFVLALGASTWTGTERTADDGEGLAATIWQGHVAGRVRVRGPVEVGGFFEIGELAARGVGVDTVLARTVSWSAVGASVSWRRGLGPRAAGAEIVLEFDGLWPLSRPNFVVDGEPRFTPGPCARGLVGVSWRFL